MGFDLKHHFIQVLHLCGLCKVPYRQHSNTYRTLAWVKSLTILYKISGDVYMFTRSFIHWTKIILLRWKDSVSEGEYLTSDSIIIKYVNILLYGRQADSLLRREEQEQWHISNGTVSLYVVLHNLSLVEALYFIY